MAASLSLERTFGFDQTPTRGADAIPDFAGAVPKGTGRMAGAARRPSRDDGRMDETVIRADHLTKSFGKSRGIIDLSFGVGRGEVFGYLGPNGAGKTTTIRTFLDLLRPTSGRADVFGLDARRDGAAIRRRVGYLPGDVHLYEAMTGLEHLGYIGSLYGGVEDGAVAALAERLDCDLSQRIASMSHGTRQKVALIAALMRSPDLLLLDEPTQGLDPLMQQEFYRLVAETRDRGGTVFLSSHVLPEVERVCDRVAIIREGRLVTVEHIADLKARAVRRIEIHLAAPAPHAAFKGVRGVTDVRVDGSRVLCTVSGDLDAVIKATARFHVVNVVSHEPTLEEIFLAYYGKAASDAA